MGKDFYFLTIPLIVVGYCLVLTLMDHILVTYKKLLAIPIVLGLFFGIHILAFLTVKVCVTIVNF